jgi:REP element-mobilizing transposase RayT
VTICTFKRRCLLGKLIGNEIKLSSIGTIVENCWRAIPAVNQNAELDAFVVMPNHLHGIIWIEPNTPNTDENKIHDACHPNAMSGSLGRTINLFKGACTRVLNEKPVLQNKRLWQRGYYEHIIRDEQDLFRVRNYVMQNPIVLFIDEIGP